MSYFIEISRWKGHATQRQPIAGGRIRHESVALVKEWFGTPVNG